MRDSAPRVSVIIPTYQCDRYITQAIDSVLSQTHCSFEIIVIDDGSTDQTRERVRSCVRTQANREQDEMILYYYQDNQGVCAARNRGVELAQGDLIAFLDADDYFLPQKLVRQVEMLDQHLDWGFVHSGWQRVDSNGALLQAVSPWKTVPELSLENWLRFKPVLPSAMMFRRVWLEQVGGFDPTYQVAEDVDLVLRLSLAGCAAGWLEQITVAYRQHPQNTMTNGLAQARDVQRVLDHFFAQPNLPQHIQLIQANVRYGTLVWIACYLYQTGHIKEMVQHLQRAYFLSPYSPTETITHWTESLVVFLKDNDQDVDIHHWIRSPDWQKLVKWVISQ